jgi:hypothetical protein
LKNKVAIVTGWQQRDRQGYCARISQIKWVQAIEFAESFKDLGSWQGGFNEDYEYYDWRQPI